MEIPKEIVGRNRIRDTRICLEYISGKSAEEIAVYEWVKLTPRRVYRILFANQPFINPRVVWPKARRIWMLQRMIDNAPETKKDVADLVDQHRKEAEGDKPLVDNSQHTHISYVWKTGNNDGVHSPELPAYDTPRQS